MFFLGMPTLEQIRPTIMKVVERRIETAPVIWRKRHPKLGKKRDVYMSVEEDYVSLALLPAAERLEADKRFRKFGTVFPGLFSVNGKMTYRYEDKNMLSRVNRKGGVRISAENQWVCGDDAGGSVIVTECFLDLLPDSSIILENLRIRSSKSAFERYDYFVHLAFFVAFGEKNNIYNAGQVIDDLVTSYVAQVSVLDDVGGRGKYITS